MLGLSNTVLYVIGAALAATASVVIGWNVWHHLPETKPAGPAPAGIAREMPASPTPASSTPASPTPASPTPASPTPAAPATVETPAAPQIAAAIKPQFDVVRVEPTGEAVAAGRAEPKSKVILLASGKPVGEAEADAAGQFVIIATPLPPGDHLLSLRAVGKGELLSDQTVAVVVPERGSKDVVVALAEPGKPTQVLSDAKPIAAVMAPGTVSIRSVEAQQGGAFFASGTGAAGAQIRLYLNDAFVAAVKVAPDGRWSVTVEKGMSAGNYAVRADLVSPDDGKVLARSEVAFAYPAATEPAQKSQVAAAFTPKSDAGAPVRNAATDAVVPELRTAKVERGDSLWRISRVMLGQGVRYTQIYDANTAQIRNPRLIYPGQVLVMPNAKP
ncbi:LysM peptidoglycan-binding domain-containing protein [Roseiarcaceae bacterium H3SJ34-1]|uniref:LysM peptidoglycan-binding domain-containing protein n=1 Tax=Terripilifer ovatus TaxID=3032367 RepID=UPI003AB984F7|nr:LysM peptidoglycan-binding domain-containing protein [Roseiarcaceae bacterium H3SJ34-1]